MEKISIKCRKNIEKISKKSRNKSYMEGKVLEKVQNIIFIFTTKLFECLLVLHYFFRCTNTAKDPKFRKIVVLNIYI